MLADRYRVERELGAGGMATVYLAEDLKHHRKVAIKVLHAELSAILGPERFLKEIELTANLQHPHILPLFDSGSADGLLYYVMPYVEGETLRDRLSRDKQLSISDAVRIATEAADALEYAHGRGIVHRDVKPENILLQNGHALVADFGIALAVQQAGGARMTQTGLSLGTPQYMSPEQAMGEREIGPRSDIYSLGAVTYEMLVGEPPFTGPTAQAIVAQVITSEPRSVTARRKSVPASVDDAVLTALEKLPADRSATAAEFGSALTNESRGTSPRRPAPTTRRHAERWMLLGVAVTTILAASVTAVALRHHGSAAPATPLRFSLSARADEGLDPGDFALSADGHTVVFVGTSDGVSRLYRRSLDDMAAEPIRGTNGAMEPVISPDGRWIAYAAPDRTIKKVPIDGGPATTLLTTTEPAGMTWSATHGLVLGMPAFSPTVRGLSVVSANGDSTVHVLTHPPNAGPGAAMNHGPYVLHDNETVLYTVINRTGPRLGIGSLADSSWRSVAIPAVRVVGVADGILLYQGQDNALMAVAFDARHHTPVGNPVRVNGVPSSIEGAVMARNGTLVMLLHSQGYQVVLVNDAGAAVPLLPDTVGLLAPRYSPDGRSVALLSDFGDRQAVSAFDLNTRTLFRLGFGLRASSVAWTPDGARVLSGDGGVVWQAADARDAPSLLVSSRIPWIVSADLSPDGQTLALGTGFGVGGFNIFTRSAHGDSTMVPFVATRANEVAPRFSPDGQWLAYASDATGKYEVYVRPFPGPGPLVHISDGGGTQPVWSRDGRHIFYRIGRAMMVADVAPGSATAPLVVTARRHLFDGDYYGGDIADAASTPHGTEITRAGTPTYDVAPDGHHFLMARAIGGGQNDLVVWMHWLSQVKRQLKNARSTAE